MAGWLVQKKMLRVRGRGAHYYHPASWRLGRRKMTLHFSFFEKEKRSCFPQRKEWQREERNLREEE